MGVLSLQGDFACHRAALEPLGVEVARVTLPADLAALDALVIPGGESTTMLRLMHSNGLRAPLAAFARQRPVLGTCAGLIVLGTSADRLPHPPLGALDVTVERNAYGRQLDSFEEVLEVPVLGGAFHGVFIRAPRIGRLGRGVEVIARRGRGPRGEVVGVRQRNVIGLTFHPELADDSRLHEWFVREVVTAPRRRNSEAA
ncbi:MAG: pyridoxal 5'-phosphate synthase glutaminase subunit PdxT [Candidatus Eisenbacteria bacterium]|uniref:Pyridoxal 5'-phosphate synthase subunit PdxT n=1 Tax=Eiseniibacteriota bacterium TaxID=2212470 RepID=A0A849SQA3_UNCEI|nr:pyridoxal 5'-phosphate synthase glutaminase subunit PdxT [Candidatus Eisenbacteria bacterium]